MIEKRLTKYLGGSSNAKTVHKRRKSLVFTITNALSITLSVTDGPTKVHGRLKSHVHSTTVASRLSTMLHLTVTGNATYFEGQILVRNCITLLGAERYTVQWLLSPLVF